MDKTTRSAPTLITTEETVLCTNILATTPRLTPTGKISHAKTRVYTQRYRKDWEQMPDFKGWLTSVPFQPTRAYCIYCKKNLHAHRLSLLKHTCTMKHQRAALAHQAEEKKAQKLEVNMHDIEDIDNRTEEGEENEEEVEYVVERLESDEEETMEVEDIKRESTERVMEDEEEEKEIDNDLCSQLMSDEEDSKPVIKKVKLPEERGRDALAEAMAHVHNEYLEEEIEDHGNVQMEVVVEDSINTNIQAMSILSDSTDDVKEMQKELRDNGKIARRSEIKADKKTAGKILQEDGKGDLVVTSLPILGTAYQINTSLPSTPINVTPVPFTPVQSKTITLTSGGKTLTLTGGPFQPGTHYVLNKIQGKLPTLVVADKKPILAVNQADTSKNISLSKMQQSPAVPSTSQQLPKKPVRTSTQKKLRISTHVVDTTKGVPIGGLQVSLYKLLDGRWTFVNESNTNPNGCCTDLLENAKLNCTSGRYKIHFDVDKYFTLRKVETMYPFIEIAIDVKNPLGHYHIPVLLSPFGFSTYRGP